MIYIYKDKILDETVKSLTLSPPVAPIGTGSNGRGKKSLKINRSSYRLAISFRACSNECSTIMLNLECIRHR